MPAFLFPLLVAANLLSAFLPITAFPPPPLYLLCCFSLMISCWLQSSILRKQRALKIIVLLNVCKVVVGQLCGTPPLTVSLDTSLCVINRITWYCGKEWVGGWREDLLWGEVRIVPAQHGIKEVLTLDALCSGNSGQGFEVI